MLNWVTNLLSVDAVRAVLDFGMISDDTMNITLLEGDFGVFDGNVQLNEMILVALSEVRILQVQKNEFMLQNKEKCL